MKYLIALICLFCSLTSTVCLAEAPVSDPVPEAVDHVLREENRMAALYYRFCNEPFLACEWRTISRTRSSSYELALLQELLSGPSAASTELMSVFPVGTRVLSTLVQGRTLFVTLSEELLQGFSDEPVDWQQHDFWLREAPLRRKLCIQAIIATVTENCAIDQVQILVEQKGSVTGSLRLEQSFFLDDSEEGLLVGPICRDDSLLLTLDGTINHIFSLLQEHNWEALYRYIASTDRESGMERPVYQDFVVRLASCPSLVAFSAGPATLSWDGLEATVQVSGQVTETGLAVADLAKRILHLTRENGIWRISLEQLEGYLGVGL